LNPNPLTHPKLLEPRPVDEGCDNFMDENEISMKERSASKVLGKNS